MQRTRTGSAADDLIRSAPAATPVPTGQRISAVLQRFPLISYFVIAYAISWTYVLVFLVAWPLPSSPITDTGELLGPVVAGFVMTAVMSGRDGVRDLLRRLVSWRHPIRWYVVIVVGVPTLYVAGVALLPGALASFTAPSAGQLVFYLLMLPMVALLFGPVLEEPGWRGFALPRLQRRWGPLAGTVILGVLWAFWHAPQYLTPSFSHENGSGSIVGMLVFLAGLVSIAILITWVFNHTGGSLLMAILVHTFVNHSQAVTSEIFPGAGWGEAGPVAVFAALAIALVLATRGRLGYPTHIDTTPRSSR